MIVYDDSNKRYHIDMYDLCYETGEYDDYDCYSCPHRAECSGAGGGDNNER